MNQPDETRRGPDTGTRAGATPPGAEQGNATTATVRGASWLLAATVVAGGLGYVAQLGAGRLLDAAQYRSFGSWWALLFLVVGALAGVQQEVARVSGPEVKGHRVSGVMGAASVMATIAAILLALAAGAGVPVALALGIGAAGYTLLAFLTGRLYAAGAWRLIAGTMVLDAALRAVLLVTALSWHAPDWGVVLAISLPFLLTVLISSRPLARAVARAPVGRGGKELSGSLLGTVVGALGTAVLCSGFPAALRVAQGDVEAGRFGAFIFAFVLARAPIVVAVLGLQTWLVTLFKGSHDGRSRLLAAIVGVVAVTVAAAALAAWAGPWLLRTLFGAGYELSGAVLFWIIASAAPLAVLCITGPWQLARGHHTVFTTGWLLAAGVAVAMLWLPLPFEARALLAVATGPAVGVAVHTLGRGEAH